MVVKALTNQHYIYAIFDIFRIIRRPGELMKRDKLVEISGGKLTAADVSTAPAAIIKTNDARGVATTSA